MKKIIWIIILIIFITSLIVLSMIFKNPPNNNSYNEQTSLLHVTNKNFDEEVLKSDIPVLIDFYADWCGPCNVLSPVIEKIANENSDIKVVKIDVDTNPDLAQKYNVISIPTLVVIKDGKVIDRAIGILSKEQILSMINNEF
jgi:thioredoxin